MRENPMRRILFLLLSFFFGYTTLFAGNTGKVAGRVVDLQTKEPLIGANVILQGTTMGAAADAQGYYTILNVSPGTYIVKVTFVGYTSREYQNVRVGSDLTTTLDIELTSGVVEIEPVIVVGSRMIQKDATATAASFEAKNFEALPVETFQQALQIQAGVTVGADGDIHIRGGRSNEILFLVDGVPVNDAITSSLPTNFVATNAIQELSVISGAFNAEYGNAQSGVVNITTKEGQKNLTGRVSFQTGDVVGGNADRFLNINEVKPFNATETEAILGGPVPIGLDGFTFLLSSRYYNDAGYLYGQRLVTYGDATHDNLVLGGGEYVAMNPNRVFNGQVKLSYMAPDVKLSLAYLRKDRKYQEYTNAYRLAPDGRPKNFELSDTYSLNGNYFLSTTTFASGVLSYTYSQDKSYAFDDVNDLRYKFRARDLAYIVNRNNPSGDSLAALLLGTYGLKSNELVQFDIGPSMDRTSRIGKKWNGRLDFTSQISRVHLVKAGVEASMYEIYREGLTLLQVAARPDNDFDITKEVIEYPDAKTRSHNIYSGKPYEFAVYAQDKMEFPEFVINVGVRLDLYNPNTEVPDNFEALDGATLKKTSLKSKISPRFSFAHSVTERSKLFFSYGHFFQLPPYANLFTGLEAFTNPLVEIRTGILSPVGGDRAVGNPDLKPQTTVSYEVGYEQELTDEIAVYLKTYYRNIRNLLATNIGFLSNGATYAFYTNRDYGNVRGINLTVRKRFSDSYGLSLDYTFQVAEGNASSPSQTYLNYRSEAQEQKQVVFLDWDQPHTLRWTVDFGRDGWQVGVIGKLESGYPYTPSVGSAIQGGQRGYEENSGRKPTIFNLDLNVNKEFEYSVSSTKLFYGLFVKVYNVFDTRNEPYVFSNSGRATFSSDPGTEGFVQFTQRPDYFSKPREIFVGTYIRF